jgi:hypothetical protein
MPCFGGKAAKRKDIERLLPGIEGLGNVEISLAWVELMLHGNKFGVNGGAFDPRRT